MIAEALDTLITLGWAALAWLAIFAAAAALVVATIATAILAICRGLPRLIQRTSRPAWAVSRATARRIARTSTYKEAA